MIKKYTPVLIACFVCSTAVADLWQDVSESDGRAKSSLLSKSNQTPRFSEARLLDLDLQELSHALAAVASLGLEGANISLQLPLPNGQFAQYTLSHSPVLSPALAAKYPQIRTFKAVDQNNPNNTGRLDYTPDGFHALLTHDGEEIYIDPIGVLNQYQSYYKADYVAKKLKSKSHSPMLCRSRDHGVAPYHVQSAQQSSQRASKSKKLDLSFGSNLTTYRLAIAATGEFTSFHGGTVAQGLAALVTGVNRINQVYERDLAVRLEIVGDNNNIIYTNASTDPFGNSGGDLADEAVTAINAEIGEANYDIGHVVSGQGDGGLAELGAVCGASKAAGETASDSPINDAFFIDFVAHELGHQFGSEHSFNGGTDSCAGSRAPMNAFEPGSGSTIMAYASICGEEDLQAAADAYFHSDSIEQIRTYLASGVGSSCGAATATNNSIPTVNAGADNAIPMQTPFVLSGSASDADATDNLSYVWEQMDLGPATNSRASFVDDGQRPLFRSFSPIANATRTFPQISDVVNATTTYGEILPTTARTLNFRLTVRDGSGGVVSDDRQLTVSDAAGPFSVNTPNGSRWTAGTQTVNWDVANTTAAPISCANVEILLSTDGGISNTTTLLASTANNGSASVEIPSINTSMGRVRVQCTTQPFFAVNSANIIIGDGGGSANTPPVATSDSFTLTQSSEPNNLNVLVNDSDADNDALRIVGLSNLVSGTATIAADELSINYTQADGFAGTTSFEYRVSDGEAEVTATVNITVNDAVTPPPPTPTPTPTPVPASSGGGGGSVGIGFFLLLLTLYIILSTNRQRLLPLQAKRHFKFGVTS